MHHILKITAPFFGRNAPGQNKESHGRNLPKKVRLFSSKFNGERVTEKKYAFDIQSADPTTSHAKSKIEINDANCPQRINSFPSRSLNMSLHTQPEFLIERLIHIATLAEFKKTSRMKHIGPFF